MAQQPLLIRGPFQGVISDTPSPEGPLTDFDDVLNFFVRKGRIQSRPQLNTYFAASGGNPFVRYIGNFKDANLNYHTFMLANYAAGATPAYMLTPGPTLNPLAIPGLPAGQLGSNLPFTDAHTQYEVFFANGGYPLAYLDGSNAVQFAGDTPGTCRFLGINANHLIQAYCTEPATGQTGSQNYPRRVRWSGSANQLEWNPLVDFTAGVNDLLEVPDELTGMSTLFGYTFLWRINGITVMYPTGNGLSPFSFENYSLAPDGIGNYFPYALSTFDNRTVFISQYDIHLFDSSTFSSLGGQTKKRIFADLAANSGDVVWGRILPNLGLGFDFLCYILTIPGPNVSWIYTYDDQQWVRFSSSSGVLSAVRNVYTS